MISRTYRYRIYPTAGQERLLEQFAGVCRLVYNLALEQRRDHWRAFRRATGNHISYISQNRELTALRAEYDWIAAVSSTCQTNALRDLEKAFSAFFAGRASYPKPRRRGTDDTFRVKGTEVGIRKLSARWSSVRLPKIGWVKFRDTRPMRGDCQNVTVKRDITGWHVSFACKMEREAGATNLPAVGIDRGVANTLALSTGEMLSLPSMDHLDARYRRAQRTLARRKKGSKRRLRQLRRCARIAAKRARVRRDWQHRASTSIARRFGHVALEDLRITNMTARGRGKRGLNRSIMNQGWHAFELMLAYKLEERGGTLDKVPAAYTSLTCSECGTVDRQSRESQSVFACRHCGHTMHADINAAINIARRSAPGLRAEASGYGASEARTVSHDGR